MIIIQKSQRAIVWPAENSFDIDLSVLQDAKQERNRQMQEPGSSLSVSDVFIYPEWQSQDFSFGKSESEQRQGNHGWCKESDKNTQQGDR